MILTNNGSPDNEDVGVLFHAMCVFGQAAEPQTDISLVARGFAVMLRRADRAARELAARVDYNQEWDSCVWFERLENTDEGSLAAALFLIEDGQDSVLAIRNQVVEWLACLED